MSCSSKSLLLFLCFVTRTFSLSPPRGVQNTNINECQKCKVLTDSFEYWFEKTSRGKFEGGDAAWEENKLKSYSRSEIRLVEIQEKLCSEVKKYQDQCYSQLEEAEQPIEKWWFLNDPNSLDLYTWLCIDTLLTCCPKNHFGASCLLCPLGKNNKVCSDNGKCDGDETRGGNGTCLCKLGYTGRLCEECNSKSYSQDGECKPCHRACEGCHGGGLDACKACRKGWQMQDDICVDIDECSTDPTACKGNQYCLNKVGSYLCQACHKSCKTCSGPGSSNCTSCEREQTLWTNICVDDKLKSEILSSCYQRTALYSGLLLMVYYIMRNSKQIASVVVLTVASYIYFSEKTSRMSLINIYSNLLK